MISIFHIVKGIIINAILSDRVAWNIAEERKIATINFFFTSSPLFRLLCKQKSADSWGRNLFLFQCSLSGSCMQPKIKFFMCCVEIYVVFTRKLAFDLKVMFFHVIPLSYFNCNFALLHSHSQLQLELIDCSFNSLDRLNVNDIHENLTKLQHPNRLPQTI